MTAWPDGKPIQIGQVVNCERKKKSKGTWTRYDGKRGVVEAVDAGEVCVVLEGGVRASFLPDELILLPASIQTDATRSLRGPTSRSKTVKRPSGRISPSDVFQGLSGQSTDDS